MTQTSQTAVATDFEPVPAGCRVSVIMGSRSDLPTMQACRTTLDELQVPHEALIVSAHRTPAWMLAYAHAAAERGIEVIVAAAGGAAHLPGMVAACTHLPVLGVPMATGTLQGVDSLLSIVQMPREVPVGTLAVGAAGAVNAALLAAQILALHDAPLRLRLQARRQACTEQVLRSRQL
jgi:5-(carboxyamino)imidazole ribonucleotide mutase